MDVGIVVVNYNTFSNTVKCVNSIIETCTLNYRIIIVDNRSANDSVTELRKVYKNCEKVEIIASTKNGGYSAGANLGIKRAIEIGCENVIISNNDLIYKKNSIEHMFKVTKQYSNVGVVGPKIVDNEGNLTPSIKGSLTYKNYIFSKKPLIYFDFWGIHKNLHYYNYDYKELKKIDGMVGGESFLLSKDFLYQIGYLDENIFLYYEEDAIALQLKTNNLFAYIQPLSEIIHFGSQTIKKEASSFSLYYRYLSSMYVLKQYLNVSNLKLFYVFLINYFGLLMNYKDKSSKEYSRKLYHGYKKYCKMR